MFTTHELVSRARKLARREDLWGNSFAEGFSVLVDAIDSEARLLPGRLEATAVELVEHLVTRARIASVLEARPDILDTPIPRPIFITGLPRSGTTLLHNLMAQAPGYRAWRLWELRAPAIPLDAPMDWPLRQLRQTRTMVDALYTASPRFRAIHPIAADAPDECNWMLRRSFHTPVWSWSFRIPSYTKWLRQADHRPAYREYRQQLQLLRWLRPGGRLVMKDPGHLWAMEALLETFPDAKVIRLQRTHDACLPSLGSLCHALWSMGSEGVRPQDVGRAVVEMVETALSVERQARVRFPENFIDVAYSDLVADPVGTVRNLGDLLGSPVQEEGADRLKAWLQRQERGPRHHYSAEEFGISAAELEKLRAQEA